MFFYPRYDAWLNPDKSTDDVSGYLHLPDLSASWSVAVRYLLFLPGLTVGDGTSWRIAVRRLLPAPLANLLHVLDHFPDVKHPPCFSTTHLMRLPLLLFRRFCSSSQRSMRVSGSWPSSNSSSRSVLYRSMRSFSSPNIHDGVDLIAAITPSLFFSQITRESNLYSILRLISTFILFIIYWGGLGFDPLHPSDYLALERGRCKFFFFVLVLRGTR